MEGTHKEFKANHTFRTELPLGQFIQMLEQLVQSFTLFGFSPLCIMKCVLESPATEKSIFAIGAFFWIFSSVCF